MSTSGEDSTSLQGQMIMLQKRVEELEFALTECEQTLQAKEQSELQFRVLAEHMPLAFFVQDLQYRTLYVSPAYDTLWGRPREELYTRTEAWMDGIHPEDRAYVEQRLADLRFANEELEYRLVRPDGSVRWIMTRAIPLRNAQGVVYQLLGIAVDITELKLAQLEQIRLQERMIQLQAATLAELSTPLIPISNRVLVMPLIGALDTQRAQQILDTLLRGVESLRAQMVIIDITGVPVVDTQVANVLIQATQAVRLLGTDVAVSGIRPEVAQTLVGLGINLANMTTHSTLQSAVAAALHYDRTTVKSVVARAG
jgi:rsbT co-antagonist protein RsbR